MKHCSKYFVLVNMAVFLTNLRCIKMDLFIIILNMKIFVVIYLWQMLLLIIYGLSIAPCVHLLHIIFFMENGYEQDLKYHIHLKYYYHSSNITIFLQLELIAMESLDIMIWKMKHSLGAMERSKQVIEYVHNHKHFLGWKWWSWFRRSSFLNLICYSNNVLPYRLTRG